MVDMPVPADAVVRGTRAAVALSIVALIALGLAWELWLAPTGARSLALKVLPLAVPLAGVLKFSLSSYRALSLLVWLYVCEGALRASSDSGLSARLAGLELLLCALLFAACVLHIRWRLRAARPQSA
jgi:uncharacterized membrane protein